MISGIKNGALTHTKLYRPRASADQIQRPRLNKRLTESLDRSLILVTAPAGFGKSMLLSTWLETCDLPYAWLSLDDTDNDLHVFLEYFTAAVRTVDPDALAETSSILAGSTLPSVNVIARRLINDLDELGRDFILVLDDFHTIRERVIFDLLRLLLDHPPQNMHLVISSRLEPSLPLGGYRARGEIADIRGNDLLFSKTEIETFVEQALGKPLTADALAVLVNTTEGWAAGIRLTLLTLRTADDINKHLVELHIQNRYVTDYLMSEVLTNVPPTVRIFLLKTSILNEIYAPLAQAFFDNDDPEVDPQECLAWLKRAGMFIETLDFRGEWYRYHHLFQMLLSKERARQLTPEEVQGLHNRASAWYASHGYTEQALRHALDGQDPEAAVRLVAQLRHHLLNTEQRPRLERWLRMFTDVEIAQHPDLLLSRAWIALLSRADSQTVLDLVNHAQALVDVMPGESERAHHLQGEIDTLRSIEKSFAANDPPGAIALTTRALETLPQEWYLARSEAWLHLALAYQMSGQLDRSHAVLAEGLREDGLGTESPRVRILGSSGFIHWLAADLASLIQAAQEFVRISQTANLSESLCWGHYFLASAYYQHNDLNAAEFHANAMQEQRYSCHRITVVQTAILDSLIHQARGEPEQARLILDRADEYLTETHSEALKPVIQAYRAELAARQGDVDSAGWWTATVGPHIPLGLMAFSYAPQLTLPKVLLTMNTPASIQQAEAALSILHGFVTQTHNTRFAIDVLALQALGHHASGNEPAALQALDRALIFARPGGFIRTFVDLGSRIVPLLVHLQQRLSGDIFIDQILAAFDSEHNNSQLTLMSGQSVLIESLTSREMEVLELLEQRLTDKEIAEKLSISPRTAMRHTANLYQKLGVSNRREAVVAARSLGIL